MVDRTKLETERYTKTESRYGPAFVDITVKSYAI